VRKAAAMVNANKHLFKQGERWYVAVEVPQSLRSILNTKRLTKSLGTDDVRQARLLKHHVVGEFKSLIDKARRGKIAVDGGGVTGKAMVLRQALQVASDRNDADSFNDLKVEQWVAAEDVGRQFNLDTAKAFYDVASGLATPLGLHLESWLNEKDFTERTKADHRHALSQLTNWLRAAHLVETIEAITDKVAGRFKTEALVNRAVNFKTANKLLSGLRTYWRWLEQHGHVERNPWAGKSLPKLRAGSKNASRKERAFTDDELVALLRGTSDEEISDVMMVAALSGIREEAIFQLTVKDCHEGVFEVAPAKREIEYRKVPIHPVLKAIVHRRSHDKKPSDYLFHEAKSQGGWDGIRSMAFSKRFGYYRKGLGVDEVIAGQRRSLVNFHSFRRWFITKADQAGCRMEDIERVVGHKVQSMSGGLYSSGATIEQLRKVVESVKLPKKVLPK
jgi:integrase